MMVGSEYSKSEVPTRASWPYTSSTGSSPIYIQSYQCYTFQSSSKIVDGTSKLFRADGKKIHSTSL